MASEVYRGVMRGGRVVLLEEDTPLMEGTEVFVTPVGGTPGTPAAVLAVVVTAPPVPAEWVDELEQLIAQGHRPPNRKDPFLHDPSPLLNGG